jgi:hypothetical protein
MEEPTKDKEPSLEDNPLLKEYEDVFWKFLGLPLKIDINFSIDLMSRTASVSKNPYITSTSKLK